MDADPGAAPGDFEIVELGFAKFCRGISQRRFNGRPAPDRWSIGWCVNHLTAADARILPPIERAIVSARGARPETRGPSRQKRTRGVSAPRFEFVSRWFASA